MSLGPFIPYNKKQNPCKNSQSVKNSAALKSLDEKSCEIKGSSQENNYKDVKVYKFLVINSYKP